jgi:hypothetical protein
MDWTTQAEGTDIKEPLGDMVDGDWERGAPKRTLEDLYAELLATPLPSGIPVTVVKPLLLSLLTEAVQESWNACCQGPDDHSMTTLHTRIRALPDA